MYVNNTFTMYYCVVYYIYIVYIQHCMYRCSVSPQKKELKQRAEKIIKLDIGQEKEKAYYVTALQLSKNARKIFSNWFREKILNIFFIYRNPP